MHGNIFLGFQLFQVHISQLMQIWSSQSRQLEIDMQNHGLEFDGTKDVEAQMLRDIRELKHIVRVTIIRNLDLLYLQVVVLVSDCLYVQTLKSSEDCTCFWLTLQDFMVLLCSGNCLLYQNDINGSTSEFS